MTPAPIPLMRVEGIHRDVGRQIGEATAVSVRARAAIDVGSRAGLGAGYREVTAAELPWLIEELDGVAEGAGADPAAVFAAGIEELSGDGRNRGPLLPTWLPARRRPPTGTCGWRTTTISTRGVEDDLVAIEWHVAGRSRGADLRHRAVDQRRVQLAGLALTGNELSPNDNRIGIPRLLQVRDMVRRRTLDGAVAAALHPAPGVVVQQRAQPPRRRGRERRGLGHRRRARQPRRDRARWPTQTTT